jgi:hypothetical protein
MEVVKTPRLEGITEFFEELALRARDGEFSTVLVVAFKAGDSTWFTAERGVRLDRLRAIGVFECMKLDLMRSMDIPNGGEEI